MHRVTWLLMLATASGCIVDDWRFQPLDASALDADAPPPSDDVAAPDVDASATPDVDVTSPPDADVATPSDADVPLLSDAPMTDGSPADVPPPPPGVVVRGAIAPSGAHSSAAARVRGSLSFVGRRCNAVGTACVTGGISP
jgi:hypothetical protein